MEELNQELARAAYDRFLPAAMALPAERVQPFRIDPDLAINNVNKAMAVLELVRDRMAEHLPRIALADLEALPALALAVKASAMAAQHVVAEVSITEMISEGWKLRGRLMPVVASLAANGVIPQAVYDKIVSGNGVRDMAEDNVAISHVFVDYKDQVAGKHAADQATIDRAGVVGSWLLQNLRKKNAPTASSTTAETDIRDRMATLLVERYSDLRAVAFYFLREAAKHHVPSLMSRRIGRKRQPDSQPDTTPQTPPSPSTTPAA